MRRKNIEASLDDLCYTGSDIGIYIMSFNFLLMHFYGYMESLIDRLRPGRNGRHFADSKFKCFLFYDNCFLVEISQGFVPDVTTDNISALVQIMAWCQTGVTVLSKAMMGEFTDAYM